MIEIIPFCKAHDPGRPNFLKMAIRHGRIREERGEPGREKFTTGAEKEIIRETEDTFYKENW